jgi:transcriptional regulator with XRE-family HTH domain
MMDSIQCKMARAALGWSTAELAKRAGTGIATVNRFELAQGGWNTANALIRAFEAAGVEFHQTDDGGSVKVRRLRPGDLVRLRRHSKLSAIVKSEIGKVVEVESYPPQPGPTYRVSVDFPDSDRLNEVFSFHFELVKAAPQWSSTTLTDFQVLRYEEDFDGVVVHCFDGQKLVIALVQRTALAESPALRAPENRTKIADWAKIIDANIGLISEVIKDKYFHNDYKMLNRYGSTHPSIEVSLADIQRSGKTFRGRSSPPLERRA